MEVSVADKINFVKKILLKNGLKQEEIKHLTIEELLKLYDDLSKIGEDIQNIIKFETLGYKHFMHKRKYLRRFRKDK